MAENCGYPTPATTRVVQIEPGPIPTFTPSAPDSAKKEAASAVAMFPTTTSKSLHSFFIFLSTSTTPCVCPCAVSITTQSTPAFIKAEQRSKTSCVTPTAAATRRRP